MTVKASLLLTCLGTTQSASMSAPPVVDAQTIRPECVDFAAQSLSLREAVDELLDEEVQLPEDALAGLCRFH